VIAVNVATMIGYRQKGLRGAAMATLGVVCPSIIIILLIAGVLKNVSHLAAVQHAFGGIRVAVSVLILSAITKLFKSSVVDPLTAVIFVVGLGITLLFHPSPILLVLCAGALGIGVKYFGARGKRRRNSEWSIFSCSMSSSKPDCSRWAAGWRHCRFCTISRINIRGLIAPC
ncbi:MAG: chromate transporter, partial [Oscillospiraceae bacterium]